jgi:hypothetical protein
MLFILANGTPRKHFMLSQTNGLLSFFPSEFERLYSLRLSLSTLIYSHSNFRVSTYRGCTHLIDPYRGRKAKMDIFRPVIQKQLENFGDRTSDLLLA